MQAGGSDSVVVVDPDRAVDVAVGPVGADQLGAGPRVEGQPQFLFPNASICVKTLLVEALPAASVSRFDGLNGGLATSRSNH